MSIIPTVHVLSATAPDGSLLPLVDVTSPAFAIAPSAEELASMQAQYVRESTQGQSVPPEVMAALGRSRLGRGLIAARGTFLTGLNTYLLKLGPGNLPADCEPIDHRIAASFPAITSRLRLQDMAALLSAGLGQFLAEDVERPLHFINIAGGPGADSWNALLRLRQENAEFSKREIVVSVMDVDDEGPTFG